MNKLQVADAVSDYLTHIAETYGLEIDAKFKDSDTPFTKVDVSEVK